MKTSECLTKAAALVEKGWTKRASARDARGRPVSRYGDAVSFCAIGAIDRVANRNDMLCMRSLKHLQTVLGDSEIVAWNDDEAEDAGEVATALLFAAELAR